MTTTACTLCGTQTEAGTACQQCGTPVPAHPIATDASGHISYWTAISEKLQQAMAPKHRVIALLGYGGMAGVFVADEVRLGRKVAVKVMAPALMLDAQLVDRFIQEARTIAKLTHPNIVTIHEVEGRDDLYWFTMTYVGGRTLGQVMAEAAEPLSIAVVRAWLYQIGDALAYAHANGVVHRDIKPGNVLLDTRGNALVTDFGIAKVANAEAGLTRTGMLVGTPAYMSPEQCSSGSVTGASDQYSLGAVVYHMLTGQAPFEGPTLAVLQAHVSQEPVPITDLRPDCPPKFAQAVHRMLAKRVDERWPTIADAVRGATAEPPGFDDAVRYHVEELATHAATIVVASPEVALREGSKQALQITVRDVAGRELPDRRVHWEENAVAAVVGAELLALSAGTTQLLGASGGARTTLTVTVEADPVRSIELAFSETSINTGDERSLEAAVYDLDGTRLDGRAVCWTTSDPAIAQLSPSGKLTAIAQGEVVIAARTGGQHATATITVRPSDAASALSSALAARARRTTSPPAPMTLPDAAVADASMPAPTPVTKSPARRGRMLAVGAVVILVAVAGFVQQLRSRAAPPPTVVEPDNIADAPPPASTLDVSQQPANAAPSQVAERAVQPPSPLPADTAPNVAAQQQTIPTTQPTVPAQTVTVPVVAEATLTVLGNLPTNAVVSARDHTGRIFALGPRPVTLPPGTYRLQFSAPGYESDERTFVLDAGEQQSWTPTVRAIVVQRDTRADQAQIETAVRDFVEAFNRRDAGAVVPLMPSNIRSTWRQLLEDTRRVTEFSATLADRGAPRIDADAASIPFTVNLSFRNQNQVLRPALNFVGRMQRGANGWRLVSLETGSR